MKQIFRKMQYQEIHQERQHKYGKKMCQEKQKQMIQRFPGMDEFLYDPVYPIR